MKISEIIKTKRLELHLTQEQLATAIGVSTPAVNKWEKGISYPDITTLPALARILHTDMNTLLSFKDDLTQAEIGLFANQVAKLAQTEGFLKVYTMAMDKIKEYPNCNLLIYMLAMILDGSLMMSSQIEQRESYELEILTLLERIAKCDDESLSHQAQAHLINKYMTKKEYAKADRMIQQLPNKQTIDKKQLQINLHIAHEQYEEAAILEEGKLLTAANEIHATLMRLMEIALKDGRDEDALEIANRVKQIVDTLDLWEYSSYIAHFEYYTKQKKRIQCLKTLAPMLASLTKKWDINASPLYRHIKTKKTDDDFGIKMREHLISSIQTDPETEFLRADAGKELSVILNGANACDDKVA